MIKLIIFDLDGTLLDTLDDIVLSTNFALSTNNFPTHSTETIKSFIGNGLNMLIKKALPINSRNTDTIIQVKDAFTTHYFAHSDSLTKPYEGISVLLENLENEGIQLAVASNKVHDSTNRLVKLFFPKISFQSILGQREGFPTKPNPAILNEIIEKSRFAKNEIIYVGDSGVDAACAYNAKVKFIGILWGFRTRKELEEVGATVFANNTEDLYRLIELNAP